MIFAATYVAFACALPLDRGIRWGVEPFATYFGWLGREYKFLERAPLSRGGRSFFREETP